MGCKFSRNRFSRGKRGNATRDNQEAEGQLKTRDRGERVEQYQPAADELQGEANDKEAVNNLVQVGIDENIANELVLRREKGLLETNRDIAAVLEKNNKKYQLHLNDSVLVRVNSLGELSFQNLADEIREELPEKAKVNSKEKININTASEKALEAIKGIGPTLASRIIQYRQEHGPFAKVEDVVSVRGVSKNLLEKIIPQITVESSKSNDTHYGDKKRTPTNHKISTFTPCNDTVRIASWNLLSFSSDKADNTGVREVICRTILENG